MKNDSSTELWNSSGVPKLEDVTGWSISKTNYSFTFGNPVVTFPLAGYKSGGTETEYPGKRAGVWSSKSSSSSESAYFLNIRSDKNEYNRESTGRARMYSVRCVAE